MKTLANISKKVNTSLKSATAGGGVNDRPTTPEHDLAPTSDPGLVSSPIFHRGHVNLFRRSFQIKRSGAGNHNPEPPSRSGSTINSFSKKSRSRLRFLAANSCYPFISQFCLTYHETRPGSGKQIKKHLDSFLKVLRRKKMPYLWILEFQTNGNPHFHLFLTVEPDVHLGVELGTAWNRITAESDDHLRFHTDTRNFIPWDMGTASYLAKYLDKEAQKTVPDHFSDAGRFWGNSRDIKPVPLSFSIDDLDDLQVINPNTGEIIHDSTQIIRWLGRLAEKQTRGYSRFRTRAATGSYTILDGAAGYGQIEDYFSAYSERLCSNDPTLDLHQRINERADRYAAQLAQQRIDPGTLTADAYGRSDRPRIPPQATPVPGQKNNNESSGKNNVSLGTINVDKYNSM